MKKLFTTALLCAACITAATAQTTPSWPQAGREAKAGSRWWWLGSAVDEDNLKWNLQQMAQAGMGTLEITPIYGVRGNASHNIQFLSGQWLDMLRLCREQGELLGIDIDMATGTGWPCGGPMVKREESAAKLATETFDIEADGTTAQTVKLGNSSTTMQCIVAFPQTGTEGEVTDITHLADAAAVTWTPPVAGKWKVIAAYCQPGAMQVKRPAPGSEGLVVDYFDSTAVANYLKHFDQRFEEGGGTWPHSFFNDSYEINTADWTRSLLQEFEKRRGYRLQEYIDILAGVAGTYRKSQTATLKQQIYSDYRQTLAEMLRDNFTRQWTAWAHRHGATTRNQAHGSPGNIIDLYAEADIPETENFYMNSFGIKGLRNDDGYHNDALSSRATLKYASSAAHVTGKKLTSSESMTWLTEHFRTSLSQIKPELDLLFTSGVNHVLFHGTAYSPREAAWPGWKFYAAIDMSPTNSIWHDAPAMMKYIERVQSFMQMGEPDNDILVYAPFANAWRKSTGAFANRLLLFDINSLDTKMAELAQCANNLEALGMDCDYTSERLLMATAFTHGQLQTAAGTRYKALVIPVGDNMPDSVKAHIETLEAQGAKVVYGRNVADLAALTDPDGMYAGTAPEAMRTEMGLSVIRRSNPTGHHYFIANLTPDDAEGYVPLAVDFRGVALFDPMTGGVSTADTDAQGRVWLSLKSGQSVIMQTYDTPVSLPDGNDGAAATHVTELAALPIGGPWTLHLDGQAPWTTEKPQTWETLSEEAAAFMGTGVYETTFTINAQQMATASAGFRLDLGDVRESARATVNGVDLGCAWAVPFVLDCRDAVREGSNTLRIEVTNLPANRIRQMDIEGTEWRIFEDANIANISTATYSGWSLAPSGLNSQVRLVPLAKSDKALTAEMTAVAERGGLHYPQFRVSSPHVTSLAQRLKMKTQDGADFSGYDVNDNGDGSVTLTVTGSAGGRAIVEAVDDDGEASYAYVPAYGPYDMVCGIDLTAESEPLGGWQKLATTSEIKGFSGTGKLTWYRSKSNGKQLTLYEGVTFESDKSNYYFYFPGYGMNTTNDFTAVFDAPSEGDIIAAAYLKGTGADTYNAADSLLTIATCYDADKGLNLPLTGNKSMTVYRSLFHYTPANAAVGMDMRRHDGDMSGGDLYFTLQGIKTRRPQRGLYIHNGKLKAVR